MAEPYGGSQPATLTAETDDDRRDSTQGEQTLKGQSQADDKVEGAQGESFGDGGDGDGGPQPTGTNATTGGEKVTQGEETTMGPPAAPASMFWTFEPGPGAKSADDQIEDPYIACRLIVAVVYLFRAGNIRYARVLGQLAVDLMGKEMWHQRLPQYLSALSDPGDVEAVYGLLGEAHRQLRLFDLRSAAFLEGVMATME